MIKIVLGSSSPYRAQLLRRLIPEFSVASPGIDESPHANESGNELAIRLACEKALAVAALHPKSLVIGCDQVAILHEINGISRLLGKPGDFETAAAQLTQCSGRRVEFVVACCLIDTGTERRVEFQDSFSVRYKVLSAGTITRYLHRDQPYGCAGSIKTESLGVALLEEQIGSDSTTLVGLPLMALTTALEELGIIII